MAEVPDGLFTTAILKFPCGGFICCMSDGSEGSSDGGGGFDASLMGSMKAPLQIACFSFVEALLVVSTDAGCMNVSWGAADAVVIVAFDTGGASTCISGSGGHKGGTHGGGNQRKIPSALRCLIVMSPMAKCKIEKMTDSKKLERARTSE